MSLGRVNIKHTWSENGRREFWQVFDAETGEEIKGIQNIVIEASVEDWSKVTLTMIAEVGNLETDNIEVKPEKRNS